jgi:hypothetical protein
MIMKFLPETFPRLAGRDGVPPAAFLAGIDMLQPAFAQSLRALICPYFP